PQGSPPQLIAQKNERRAPRPYCAGRASDYAQADRVGQRPANPEGPMRDVIRIIAIAALAALTSPAHAQVYPSRPITMNVPYAAGGPLDVMVRVVADGLRAALGQAIVIENVAGAGGSLGVGRVVRAAPDGYTISAGNWSTHVANGAVYAL